MLLRAYKYKTGKIDTGSSDAGFVDAASISGWAREAVNAAAELGLMNGEGDNRFAPMDNATRAESAQAIINLMKLM